MALLGHKWVKSLSSYYIYTLYFAELLSTLRVKMLYDTVSFQYICIWQHQTVPCSFHTPQWLVRFSWTHFTNNTSSWPKSCIALVWKIMTRSGHIFADVTTAELLSHVQNCDLIRSWKLNLELKIYMRFKKKAHIAFEKLVHTAQFSDPNCQTVLSPHGSQINSFPPGAIYMCQWIGSALVQIMACHLVGAKPLSKPMLDSCQLDPYEQTSLKF